MGLFSKAIDKRIGSYQQELVETHYREVDNMYRQIRGWRHDYRNHIQTMKAYAAAGNWEAICQYLDLLDEDLTTVDTVIKTGNPMTDAILNSKISLAKAKHIPVVADAHIPVKLPISEIDLCCIIGNLFDNAMDASGRLSIKCNTFFPENFKRRFPVETFPWTVIQKRLNSGNVGFRNRSEVEALRVKEANHIVSILVCSPLPRFMGLGKVDKSM